MERSSEISPERMTNPIGIAQDAERKRPVNFELDARDLIEDLARTTGQTVDELIENNRQTALRVGIGPNVSFSEERRVSLLTEHLREVESRRKTG